MTAANDPQSPDEIHALLGRGTEFSGKLCFDGRVRIDGRFVGEVHSDDLLILGPNAEVEGQVDVGTLIVQGATVKGDITASQLIEVHSPARIEGTLKCPQLYIEKGVSFEGKCSMTVMNTEEFDPKKALTPVPESEDTDGVEARTADEPDNPVPSEEIEIEEEESPPPSKAG